MAEGYKLTPIVDQDAPILASPYLIPLDDGVAARPDLNARVHVVEDVVLF